jgi:hypothetical protein
MYLAEVKDTSGIKQAQYQKYYRNAEAFMRSVNVRFGTSHSLDVLRNMLTSAKTERRKKSRLAMAVRVLRAELLAGASELDSDK